MFYLQGDARVAAEEEELKTRDLDLEKIRLHNDRLSRARVRHNNALEKEMLSHVSRKTCMRICVYFLGSILKFINVSQKFIPENFFVNWQFREISGKNLS